MVYSPLEQFEVVPLLGRGLVSVSNRGLVSVVVSVLVVWVVRVIGSVGNGALVPNRWQRGLESFYGLRLSMVSSAGGEEGNRYFGFIFTVFRFLLGCNLIGLIPYRFTVTSHGIVTLRVAMGVWVGKLVVGLRTHGVKLLGVFLPAGVPFAMVPVLVAIELLRFVIVLVRLPVRLFANMMAGHILLKVIGGFAWTMLLRGGLLGMGHLVPLLVLFLLMGLETGVALIQAYVFTLLRCLYLGDMIKGGH